MKLDSDSKKTKNRSVVYYFFALLLYRFILDIDYQYAIINRYRYAFGEIDGTNTSLIISYCIVLGLIPPIIKCLKRDSFSDNVIFIISLAAIIPGTSLYRFKLIPTEMLILWCLYYSMLLLLNSMIPHSRSRIRTVQGGDQFLYLITYISTLVNLYIWIRYARFRINFDLFSVYEFRAEASSYDLPTVIIYMQSMSRAVFPTMMVYFMSKRKWALVLITICGQLVSFSIDGSKRVLFTLIIALIGYFFFESKLKDKILKALIFLVSLGFIGEFYFSKSSINTIIIRRMLFLPEDLNIYYYDFFHVNEKDYFRQSFLRFFGFVSPHETPIPKIIGQLHTGKFGEGANNGLFSDAYANLGNAGMIIMPIIIILFLRMIEVCTQDVDKRLLLTAMITVPLTLISSSLFTAMITHGVLLLCVMFACMPREEHL